MPIELNQLITEILLSFIHSKTKAELLSENLFNDSALQCICVCVITEHCVTARFLGSNTGTGACHLTMTCAKVFGSHLKVTTTEPT